jgi:hypothetical protein
MRRQHPLDPEVSRLWWEYNHREAEGKKPTQAQYNPFEMQTRKRWGEALTDVKAGDMVKIKLVTDGEFHADTSYQIPPGEYNVSYGEDGIVFLTDVHYVSQEELTAQRAQTLKGQALMEPSITLTVDQMLRDEIQKTQFAEEVARKKELLRNYGVDDFEDGQILQFPKRLPNSRKDQGFETYQYAALKVKGAWYLTGARAERTATSPLQWADLVIWLIEGEWPTKAEEVGLMSTRAEDSLDRHAKQSRAIEAPQVDTTPDSNLSNEKVYEGTYSRPVKDNPQA